jgi:two-component sensor histidine kinase
MSTVVSVFPARSGWLQRLRHRHLFAGLGFAMAMVMVFTVGFSTEPFFAELLKQHGLVHASQDGGRWLVFIMAHTLPVLPVLTVAMNLAPAAGFGRYAYPLAGVVAMWGYWVALLYFFQGAVPAAELWYMKLWFTMIYIPAVIPFAALWVVKLWLFLVMAAIVTACTNRNLGRSAASKLLQSQIEGAALDTDVKRARLQLLRAQIEPHFLFNTLATVRTLARIDRAAAVEMIEHLMRYLSEALPRLRQEETSLAEELQLVDAYLRIHQIRMGTRLSYELLVPDILGAERIPTMMLLTLVENAIQHGVNPTVEGGSIRVSATREPAALVLRVSDSGHGLAATDGHGMGLANIRRRLMMLYGDDALLSLTRNPSRGVTASVAIPLLGAR